MIIAKYLGFSPKEIKGMLIKQGETDFSSLIGDSVEKPIEASDTALIEAVRKITSKDPTLINSIAHNLELAARASDVDISQQLSRLKRKKRRG
jgi:hypothetical protein